ncbi:hypothetical protein D0C28_14140 [Rhizobium sp. AU243]|nr:hypothetical protein D0C28_14140 [Rhizobium sp. AU243]
MREAGFRKGKAKPRIFGVRHKGDTAVFPCFLAVAIKPFPDKKTAPMGRFQSLIFLFGDGQPRDPLAIGS